MPLNALLEMSDEEVFELVDEEYGLSEKQEALNKIVHDMMNQLEKLRRREDKMSLEIKRLRTENESLRSKIKDKSK